MGIEYISNTYRKVLDNESISNLWKNIVPSTFFPPLHESINDAFHYAFRWPKQTSVLYFYYF